jgi:putative hydrolase of the HAD superfamily
MKRHFEMVFCDATDTLLRIHGSVGSLYAPIARRHGFESTPSAIDAAFRPALETAPPPCFPGAHPEDLARLERDWWHDVVRRTFAPLGAFVHLDAFFAEVFELFRTTKAWDLLPGVRDALDVLEQEGRRLGIVSDMDGRLLDVLDELGLRRRFDPIVLATRTGSSKRDASLFHAALAAARLEASRCVHIGDSLKSDVAAARALGITPLWFAYNTEHPAPPGVVAVRDWSEVPAVIRGLERTAG